MIPYSHSEELFKLVRNEIKELKIQEEMTHTRMFLFEHLLIPIGKFMERIHVGNIEQIGRMVGYKGRGW